MYTSKHYTGEQIDQRLLQGYYDDAVANGFTGTIVEFWKSVISVSDKVSKKEGYGLSKNDFNDALKSKLERLEEINRVSQLQNDLNFQTEYDVKRALDRLVEGSPRALEALKELADTLAGNPNFATETVNKLTALQKTIDKEVDKSREDRYRLDKSINSLEAKVDTNHEKVSGNLRRTTEEIKQSLKESNKRIDSNEKTLSSLSTTVTEKVQELKDQALELVSNEANRATQAENTNKEKITQLESTVQSNNSRIDSAIQEEKLNRIAADSELTSKLDSETSKRTAADKDLDNRLVTEVTERRQAITTLESSLTNKLNTKDTATNAKVDKEIQDRKTSFSELDKKIAEETKQRIAADTENTKTTSDLKGKVESIKTELTDKISEESTARTNAYTELKDGKVDKQAGKVLSSNDFTDAHKAKLEGIEALANKVSKVSQLQNDLKFQTLEEVEASIQRVMGVAPDTINTLKELSKSLEDGSNTSATIISRITAIAEQLNQNKLSIDGVISDVKNSNDVSKQYTNLIKTELLREISALESRYISADNVLKQIISSNKLDQEKVNNGILTKLGDLYKQLQSNTNNTPQVTENTAAIQRNLTLIQRWEKELNDTKEDILTKIKGVNTSLNSTAAELREQLTSAVNSYTQGLTDLDRSLKQYVLSTLESSDKINSIKNGLDSLRTAYTETIHTLEEKVRQQDTEISSLQSRLSAEERRSEGFTNKDQSLTNQVNKLTKDLASESSTSRAVEARMNQLIDTNKQSITDLNSGLEKIKSLTEEEVDTLVNDILES
jgi:hypothetical protein